MLIARAEVAVGWEDERISVGHSFVDVGPRRVWAGSLVHRPTNDQRRRCGVSWGTQGARYLRQTPFRIVPLLRSFAFRSARRSAYAWRTRVRSLPMNCCLRAA